MTGHPGWYPPGQVSHPPELPTYLKNVYDLKPIIGVPTDNEVIGIHTVMQAARKASEIPGMHDPGLLMSISDHLFNVQMARYRSKYSLITFPSDATYTPPTVPAHISIHLEPVSGAPTDDEMTKVQDSLLSYQRFSHAPSMFDPHVNMELSQHLFNIQMARYMRQAGESQPSLGRQEAVQPEGPLRTVGQSPNTTNEANIVTNNAGTGANATMVPGIDVRELMEQSNQLSERFNRLLEQLNEIVERCGQPSDQSNSLFERFNQVFERFNQLIERTPKLTEQSDLNAERFNQLFERFTQLVEQSSQPAHRANELAERSNELAERANQLSERANKSGENSVGLAKNINRVLMAIQHAIVRSHKGNTPYAVDCLVDEKGQTPREAIGQPFRHKYDLTARHADHRLPVRIGGVVHDAFMYNMWLGRYLCFYGIGEAIRQGPASAALKEGKEKEAREILSDYLSSCLG